MKTLHLAYRAYRSEGLGRIKSIKLAFFTEITVPYLPYRTYTMVRRGDFDNMPMQWNWRGRVIWPRREGARQ